MASLMRLSVRSFNTSPPPGNLRAGDCRLCPGLGYWNLAWVGGEFEPEVFLSFNMEVLMIKNSPSRADGSEKSNRSTRSWIVKPIVGQ